MRTAALVTLAVLAAGGPAAARAPDWRVYADCAAAYLANARIADPGRPAAMTSQVSDVADDYAKAARERYHRQREVSRKAAARQVGARIEAEARRLAGQPRETVEKLIDACPQPPA
ncbi:MAG: hypothetical protein ACXWKM_14450 [Phenylobacterium sp.]